jgi:NAD(P)H-hydrate repair Nnr-like enzyme with NAD(P)H-hydrate epimerase domain
MSSSVAGAALFRTESGHTFPGVSSGTFNSLLSELTESYGINSAQICEAVSYSMAMIIRVALGLSAEGANVGALVSDSLSGWCSLATIRHLANAGTKCHVIIVNKPSPGSETFQLQLKPLEKMKIDIAYWTTPEQTKDFVERIGSYHNILCGLYDQNQPENDFIKSICNTLNELQTPVHCIQAPAGLDVDSGERRSVPLFASSTLSLGIPLIGLQKGRDFTGRHYICDISLSRELYQKANTDLTSLFAEQPVVQIFPLTDEG